MEKSLGVNGLSGGRKGRWFGQRLEFRRQGRLEGARKKCFSKRASGRYDTVDDSKEMGKNYTLPLAIGLEL